MHNHNTVMCIKDLLHTWAGCKVWKICLTEEKHNHLEQLKQWLVNREYREDEVYSKIERIKLVERPASFQIRDKKVEDSIRLGITYHPALNQLYEILRRANKHVLKDFIALYHPHQKKLFEIQKQLETN